MKLRMLLSALLLATGLTFIAGCGKKAEGAKAQTAQKMTEQEKVASQFFKAYVANDSAAALKLVSMSDKQKSHLVDNFNRWAELKKRTLASGDVKDKNFIKWVEGAKVGRTKVEGDTAFVSLIYTIEQEDDERKFQGTHEDKKAFELKRIDGKWLITGYKIKL